MCLPNLACLPISLGLQLERTSWSGPGSILRIGAPTIFLDGTLPIPKSVTLPPAELPSDMVEAAPPQPQLNILTWNKQVKLEGVATLKTPASLLTQYHDHPRFGTEFKAILEQARADYPLDMADDKKEKDGKTGRRALILGPPSQKESGMVPAGNRKEAGASVVPAELKVRPLVHIYYANCLPTFFLWVMFFQDTHCSL